MQHDRASGNWNRWGTDDERGALNLITPDVVLAAARTVKTGKVYPLGLPIQPGTPGQGNRAAPQRLTVRNFAGQPDHMAGVNVPDDCGANEDVLIMNTHSHTHMDALSHVYSGNVMYNGFAASTFQTNAGATRLGVEKMGGIAGRALLLDVAANKELSWLDEGSARVSGDDLEACAAAEGLQPRAGDILLVRTGYLDMLLADGRKPRWAPGIDLTAVEYIRDNDFAAVGADNGAIEVVPFDDNRYIPVHRELVVNLGLPLFENLNLHDMGVDRVYESLLIVAPLPIAGASGSPVNPIAIG